MNTSSVSELEPLGEGSEGLTVSVARGIDAVNRNAWNAVVDDSPRGTVFHRHEWLEAVEAGLECEPRHLVVEKKGNPVGGCPNFVVDLPLPDRVADLLPWPAPLRQLESIPEGFGGPIVLTDEADVLDLVFDAVESAVGPRVVGHRIQTYDLQSVRYGQFLEARGYEPSIDACLFLHDLRRGWDAILADMDKDRRRELRKAEEQDHRVAVDPLDEDLATTHEWHVRNVERVGGSPVPRAFLEALADRLGDRFRVFRAIVDGREVGRYVYLLDEEGRMLHNWLAAIPDPSCYEYYPSQLMFERAVEWGAERGADWHNFGKTGAHFANSVFRFKDAYGGVAVPIFAVERGLSPVWPLYRFGRSRYLQAAT